MAAFGAAFAITAIEYVYGAFLAKGPPEQRARGYALMYSAIEGFATGMLFFAAIFALTPLVLAGMSFYSPHEAGAAYRAAAERLARWLLDLANLEKDLSMIPIFAPLASTVSASALLGRVSIQVLLGFSAAMAVVSEILATWAPVMFGTGLALSSTHRTRRLGAYLAISALAACIVAGALAPYIQDTAAKLKFEYRGILDFPTFLREAFFGAVRSLIEDGQLLATCLIVTSVSLGVAATAAAAASAAAGGFADSIISRIRL